MYCGFYLHARFAIIGHALLLFTSIKRLLKKNPRLRRFSGFRFCQQRPSVLPSMEERMCQKQISTIQHSHQQTDTVQTANCHRCKMCSSFSSSSSSSSISSSSSNISSSSGHDTQKQLPRQSSDKKSSGSCFIQQHLQSMFGLLRREETLKMVGNLSLQSASCFKRFLNRKIFYLAGC